MITTYLAIKLEEIDLVYEWDNIQPGNLGTLYNLMHFSSCRMIKSWKIILELMVIV